MSPDPRCSAPPETCEIKDPSGTKGVEARFYVDLPPDVMLEILWDTRHFPRLFPDIKEYRVTNTKDDSCDVHYRINAIVREFSYTLRRNLERQQRRISWRELSGDFRKVRGQWLIAGESHDGTCLVTYQTFVEIGRFVPSGVLRKGVLKKMNEIVHRLRTEAKAIHARTQSP